MKTSPLKMGWFSVAGAIVLLLFSLSLILIVAQSAQGRELGLQRKEESATESYLKGSDCKIVLLA